MDSDSTEIGPIPTKKVILGSIAFSIFWVLAVFPKNQFLPIGRTAGSLLGAMLMVGFQVITPPIAYNSIDLPILGLLFATMIISNYLEKAKILDYLGKLLSWRCNDPKDLLCRICFVSAISSSFLTNDTTCIILTEFVLKLTSKKNLDPLPFLLALASSANIGSAATPIGNPQNLVIAIRSKLVFGKFVMGLMVPTIAGVTVNAFILLYMYRNLLSDKKFAENGVELSEGIAEIGDETSRLINLEPGPANLPEECKLNGDSGDGFEHARKICTYVVTGGMLTAFLMGFEMSWTAITAALVLVVIDFKDAEACLEKVSYSLLVFFCGMFITIEGFNKTRIPGHLWSITQRHAHIKHASGIALLSLLIIVLSNLVSNVPTVLLLGQKVADYAAGDEEKAWLIMAWVSTVAGNLSLLGSAANLIVCERASRAEPVGYNLSFWSHLMFGVPSTLVITFIGLLVIW